MWKTVQNTDYNGIVLFEPSLLKEYYGDRIRKGSNLFRRFMKTDDGDEVLRLGIIVPILAIDDAGYTVIFRQEAEKSEVEPYVVLSNGVYPFRVKAEAVLADLAVLRDWEEDLDWQRVPLDTGRYAITVRGFRRMANTKRKIVDAGYEFVLRKSARLPRVTASTGHKMRVLKI